MKITRLRILAALAKYHAAKTLAVNARGGSRAAIPIASRLPARFFLPILGPLRNRMRTTMGNVQLSMYQSARNYREPALAQVLSMR